MKINIVRIVNGKPVVEQIEDSSILQVEVEHVGSKLIISTPRFAPLDFISVRVEDRILIQPTSTNVILVKEIKT